METLNESKNCLSIIKNSRLSGALRKNGIGSEAYKINGARAVKKFLICEAGSGANLEEFSAKVEYDFKAEEAQP